MRFVRFIAAPLVGLAILASTAAQADTTVTPVSQTNVNGSNGINDPLIGFFGQRTARTFQVQYDPSFHGIPVGATLTSLAFRQDESNPLPTGTVTFGDYEIYIGQGTRTVASLAASPTLQSYGANMAGEVLVRDGALTVNYDAYPEGATIVTPPNAFGPDIVFSSANYVYTGGSIVVYITHNGYPTGPNSLAPVDSQSLLNPASPANPNDAGYVLLRSNTDGAGTNSTNTSPDLVTPTVTPSNPPSIVATSVPIIRFTYSVGAVAGPEPGALAFVLLGGMAVLVRKRRG